MYRLYADYFQNAFSHYQSGFEQMTKCSLTMAEGTFDIPALARRISHAPKEIAGVATSRRT